MLDKILQLDAELFLAINHGWVCKFLDFLMPILTDKSGALILIAILVLFAIFGGKKGRIMAIFALVAVGFADLISAQFMKPFFGRIRPCHDLPARMLANCSSSNSFPSSHASNIFAFAISVGYSYRWALIGLLPLAFGVALSRVYVGVHYPIDITVGALLGTFLGLFFGYIAKLIYGPKKVKIDKDNN
ncbi:MAG: phosphatase PAP2 family protein [Candidatus Zixiibacteriota bacterium]